MIVLTRLTNEMVQRGIDAHVAAQQLFTSKLKERIHEQALQHEKTLQRKPAVKRRTLLLSVTVGLMIAAAALFFVLDQQVQAPIVTTTIPSHEAALSSELFDQALNGFSALGSNDFERIKEHFHSNVKIDEVNETVQFSGDVEPVQTNYFSAANHYSLEIQPAIKQALDGLYVILRNDNDSFEIHFQRDPLNGDEYRISSIINGN